MTSRFRDRLLAGEPATLCALGDSLTVGYLVNRGYLDMVEADLRQRFPHCDLWVENRSVCGDTIFDGTRRAPHALLSAPPHAALIQFGLNDCFSGVSSGQFRQGVTALVERLKTRSPGTEIILVPAPPIRAPEFDREAEPYRTACDDIAGEPGVVSAPVSCVWRAANQDLPLWLGDGVHPTEAGYRLMADAVLQSLLGDAEPT